MIWSARAEHLTKAGGFIAKYMGDGVLAYFGYPQAHEDDAERAVRSGLSLAEGVPQLPTPDGGALEIRIGIATGLVVVGDLIGEGDAAERGIVDATPNGAAASACRRLRYTGSQGGEGVAGGAMLGFRYACQKHRQMFGASCRAVSR